MNNDSLIDTNIAPPRLIDRKTASVVAAYCADLLSEGEAARILAIGRIEFREIRDGLCNEGEALKPEFTAKAQTFALLQGGEA